MNTHKLALIALIAAASLNAVAEEEVGFRNRHEAIAACKALTELDGQNVSDRDQLASDAELCQSVINHAYAVTRGLGKEYFVAGLGLFGGAEGNSPKLFNRVNLSGNLNYGASVWPTFNTETLLPGLRFTPLLQGIGGAKWNTLASNPSMVEFSKGFIVFVGRAKKSIFEFNGLYTGLSAEFASPLAAPLTAKNSWQVNVLTNFDGAYALLFMTTATGGNPGKSYGINEMYSYNYSQTGAGWSPWQTAKSVWEKYQSKGFEETKAELFGN